MRKINGHGQCEAVDIIKTTDDGVAVRCQERGRVIRERMDVPRDSYRLRCVCLRHGLASAMEVS